MKLTASVKSVGQNNTFNQQWRGVLLNTNAVHPDDTVAWSCPHTHATITGKGSAMDCAVFELERRKVNQNEP